MAEPERRRKSLHLFIVNLHNFTFLRAAHGFEERRTEVIKMSICDAVVLIQWLIA